MRWEWVVAALVGAAVGAWSPPVRGQERTPPPGDEELKRMGERASRVLYAVIPRAHLFHQAVNETVADKALKVYLDTLDFDRSFFLASDILEFSQDVKAMSGQLRTGDLSFAFKINDRFRDRVKNRIAYVDQLLKQGFDLRGHETYRWKRRKAEWAADEAAWNELWKKKIQNEYIARIVAVKLSEEDAKDPRAAQAKKDKSVTGRMADTAAIERAQLTGVGEEASADTHLTPEEFIRKRYRQYEILLKDNDVEMVIDRYLSAFTQAYDPHSEYMSPSRSEDFDINMSLSLCGIGAQLTSEDGAAKIDRLVPGGPAERDGRLQMGDRIVAVGQADGPAEDILHMPLYKAVRKIRGPKGTKVSLVVWPAGDISGATEKKITLVREEVKLEEQAARSQVVELTGADGRARKMGVLTLPEFYADFKSEPGKEPRRCAKDVRKLLQELVQQGVDGLALDLRNNGGGSLPDAIEMGGFFVRSGPMVQVRDARNVQVLSDPDPGVLFEGPMVVLVNRLSASASEIVAAALQDYGRAIIIGDSKTHGKGTVQTLVPLEVRGGNLGAFKVTTASFFRIAGGSTQLKGVHSDIVIPSVFDRMELGEEFMPNAMPWSVVDPAFYATMIDQAPPVNLLREKSEKRRATAEVFKAREELLDRIARRVNSETVSLNLEERMAMARSDRDLDKLQRDLQKENTGEDNDARKDPVIMESLQVLSDISAWQESLRASPAVKPATAAR
jgi:carboxyl-terminal processing protease